MGQGITHSVLERIPPRNLVSLRLTLQDVAFGLGVGLSSPSALLVSCFILFICHKLFLEGNSAKERTLLAPPGIRPSDGNVNETSY